MDDAELGVEQTYEMINLGGGGDGAFAAAARDALLDVDGGRQAVDGADVGPGHWLDELPGVGVERVEEIQKVSRLPVSLEEPIGEDSDSSLGDFIEDRELPGLEDMALSQILKETMEEALCTLTDREGRVLRLRFGMAGGRPHTLEEVGREFGVTRERIRQIEAKALQKMRSPSLLIKLRNYAD